MKRISKLLLTTVVLVLAFACSNRNSRNYQYMPNMYESVGYETYEGVDNGLFPEGTEARLPADNTIPRGYMPYAFGNTPAEKELARLQASPLDSLASEENLVNGKALYDIYCAICHGPKGKGQGHLVKREKILGVPSYDDVGRNITVGSTYHTIYYGLNSMGSYASQFANEEEMWQVAEYVMKLKGDLSK